MVTVPKAPTSLGVDGPYQEAAQHIRDLNERLLEYYKAAGNTTLDAYEKTLKSVVDFEEKVAGAGQLEWVSALARVHAEFVRDTGAAYIKAFRELLD